MTTRERLPYRRPVETFDLVAGGLKYVCTVGRFADGRIGELFLGNHKAIRPPTPARAMLPSHSRSRFSTALTPKPFAVRSVAMPTARRAVRSASRSLSSSARKDRELVR
jgi:hypothetical protein